MSQYVGKFFLVKLPQHVTDLYNSDNPALAPVEVGTERPLLVVAETIGQSQDIDSGQLNPDGTHVLKSIPLPDTVNGLVYHDGDVKPRYVTGVPVGDLLAVDSTPQTQPATAPENPPQAQNRETGQTPLTPPIPPAEWS